MQRVGHKLRLSQIITWLGNKALLESGRPRKNTHMIFGKLLLATIESKIDAVTLRSRVFTLFLAEQPSRFLPDARDIGHRLSESRKQPP